MILVGKQVVVLAVLLLLPLQAAAVPTKLLLLPTESSQFLPA